MRQYDKNRVKLAMYKLCNSKKKILNINITDKTLEPRYTALIVIKINKINNVCIYRNNKLAKI